MSLIYYLESNFIDFLSICRHMMIIGIFRREDFYLVLANIWKCVCFGRVGANGIQDVWNASSVSLASCCPQQNGGHEDSRYEAIWTEVRLLGLVFAYT